MLWKISSRCDRIPNSYNQYQAIRQDALLIKADSRAQENGTWAFNKWATQEKLAVRRHTYRLSWDNSCDQQINELYRHLKQNKSCNHRTSASASNDASRQAEEAFAWKLRLRPCVSVEIVSLLLSLLLTPWQPHTDRQNWKTAFLAEVLRLFSSVIRAKILLKA